MSSAFYLFERMDTSETIHVLLVEDNDDDAYLIGAALRGQFRLTRIKHGQRAYEHLTTASTPPDVILLDYRLPEMNGIEIIQAVQAQGVTLAYIMLTVDLQIETAIEAMKAGALDFLPKAKGYDRLPEMIRKVDRIQRDRIEKQRMTAALRESERQLRELNAQKDKFFSILAHDLRNPIESFLSGIYLLEHSDALNGHFTQSELLAEAARKAKVMQTLLENLLSWSSLQQGLLTSYCEIHSLQSLIDRNIDLLTPMAAQKQITLINALTTPLSVHADLYMSDTIIRNLMTNAVKFTPAGGTVTIAAQACRAMIEVAITDTGVGIKPEHLPGLFRIDVKPKGVGTAGEKGSGLGLILCKELAETQGGTIWVESEVGKGTTITFTLPAARAQAAASQ